MEDCLVSVVMPVYNVEKYLKEAIDSILNQTYKNIELIIIDDCSMDHSREIIKSYNDIRIRAYFNTENLQQPRTRNKGLELAKGDYIANMDSDDISYLNRIEEQVKFMNVNEDIDICGCCYKTFGGKKNCIVKTPLSNEDCKMTAIITSPVAHPTVMMRRSAIKKYNIQYDVNYKYSQDFELWSRLVFEGAKFSNIQKVLLNYRENPSGVTFGHSSESKKFTEKVIIRNLKMLFGECYNFEGIFGDNFYNDRLKEIISRLVELKNIPNKLNLNNYQIEFIINNLVKKIVDNSKIIDLDIFYILISQIGIDRKNILWFVKKMLKVFYSKIK